MTPEQALTILDQATALAHLSRPDHIQVTVALETLKRLIEEKTNQK